MKYLNKTRVLEMLTTKRPAYSLPEEEFCAKYLDVHAGIQTDGWGNRWAIIGDKLACTTMFSSHTDTVHRESGAQGIAFDEHTGDVFLSDTSTSNCLGADDTVGVALMLEMYERGVPGLYVWHRAEEVGGDGSVHFASADDSGILGRIQRCIAFDRLGTSSVITYQMGQRCMSDKAADAICYQMKQHWPKDGTTPAWDKDEGGVFTDSANYTHLIPECTNLSVGYWNQHTKDEFCNLYFLDELLETCLRVQWDTLPVSRVAPVDKAAMTANYRGTSTPEFTTWEDAYSFCCHYPEDAADLLLAAYQDYSDIGRK